MVIIYQAPDHSVCELSSDSEFNIDPKEEKEKSDDEETDPKSAAKKKSPKERLKQEIVQPKEKKKTNEPVKMEGNNAFYVARIHYLFIGSGI